jgi:hypothetical protein
MAYKNPKKENLFSSLPRAIFSHLKFFHETKVILIVAVMIKNVNLVDEQMRLLNLIFPFFCKFSNFL